MLPCQFSDCPKTHVLVESTGDKWHIETLSPQEVADVKATALQRIGEPDRQACPGDLFTLRLVATIEAATLSAAPGGHAFDYAEFGQRLERIYASATGGADLRKVS